MYEFEKTKRCLVNFKTTWEFRELAHNQAKRYGLTLTDYLTFLVMADTSDLDLSFRRYIEFLATNGGDE